MKLYKKAGIYVLRNRDNGNCYVGKDTRLGRRIKEHLSLRDPSCPAIHNAIKKHDADVFDVELIPYPNISHEALNEVEKWKIRQLKSHKSQGGYNLTWGGEGLDSETAREENLRRVEEGTHHFVGDKNPSHKRVKNGTHNFLGGEIQRKRIAEGTHHFLDKEAARQRSLKRVEEGTNPFLDSDFHRRNAQRRVEEGTHPFLGGEISRKTQRRRIDEGTHNFLNKSFYSRNSYFQRIKKKTKRRELYRLFAALLYTKSVCEERIYHKRIREGYFNKDIPDTSSAEQLIFFH